AGEADRPEATPAPAAAAEAPVAAGGTRVQAEAMGNGGGQYGIWTEAGAGGKVRGLYSEGAIAEGTLTAGGTSGTLQVRARAQLSGASAPRVRVTVDGRTAGEFTVGKAEWATYTVAGNWEAGRHSIQVQYLNDEGRRGLVLDYLAAGAAGTAPAPAPAPTASAAPQPSATSGTGAARSGPRTAALQPFTSGTFSNVAIGSGARYSPAADPRVTAFKQVGTNVNHERWSISVQQARSTDPLVTLTSSGKAVQLRIPVNATTTGGTDQHMSVIQPDGRTSYETWGMQRVSATQWTARYVVRTDLHGSGMSAGARAPGNSQLHGLIRAHELENLDIPHSVAIGIDGSQLRSVNNATGVWPARDEDGDSATSYKGAIPMGTMFALPPGVDIESLGLSPEGEALARALQDYGGHVLIRSGSVSLYAEQAADAAAVQRMKADWSKLRGMLRVVENNAADNIAGGGERRRPPAADLQ
ncbi:hypothetical protein HER39_13155, partial [Arthrobacter deserti]|nr:hypothetical protein [Arthrobacter deserti]